MALGDDQLAVSNLDLSAGHFQVKLDLRRRKSTFGKFYASYGPLSVGMGLAPDQKKTFQVLNAAAWYEREGVGD